jgi:hypothetical protein
MRLVKKLHDFAYSSKIHESLYLVFLGETSSVLLGSVLKISPLKVARNTDIQRTASF